MGLLINPLRSLTLFVGKTTEIKTKHGQIWFAINDPQSSLFTTAATKHHASRIKTTIMIQTANNSIKGKNEPCFSIKSLPQTPVALTTVFVLMVPYGVATPTIFLPRPVFSTTKSSTEQFSITLPPFLLAALVKAVHNIAGSTTPSPGEYKAPIKDLGSNKGNTFWVSSGPGSKPVSASNCISILREFANNCISTSFGRRRHTKPAVCQVVPAVSLARSNRTALTPRLAK
ncbi:hypothetical protein FF38_11558 [Lucilia cuprina]|uniref:Uncharacterized protein n=1 Tax=Lucilia cuprina TaxID=7375 RepID=A0A0L0CBB7_LUCCU|nr:hypothetical protein FF38_11558 [Lucilia cuprina]